MKRRNYLIVTCGCVGLGGCLGSNDINSEPTNNNSSTNTEMIGQCDIGSIKSNYDVGPIEHTTIPKNCKELIPVSEAAYGEIEEGKGSDFSMSISDCIIERGNTLSIIVKNNSNEEKSLGSLYKYGFQIKGTDGWVDKTRYESNDWSSSTNEIPPGGSEKWEFDITKQGLGKDHAFCGDVRTGIYRFVYFGNIPNLVFDFAVID